MNRYIFTLAFIYLIAIGGSELLAQFPPPPPASINDILPEQTDALYLDHYIDGSSSPEWPADRSWLEIDYQPSNPAFGIDDEITVEVWVKWDEDKPTSGVGEPQGIVSRWAEFDPAGPEDYSTAGVSWGFWQQNNASKNIAWSVTDDGAFSGSKNVAVSGVVPKDEWVHLAGVASISGGFLQSELYVNGLLVGTTGSVPVSNTSFWNDASAEVPIFVGMVNNPNDSSVLRHFDGQIDEIRVWSTALSQTTIQEWMSRGITKDHPNYDGTTGDDLEMYLPFSSGIPSNEASANAAAVNLRTFGAGVESTPASTAPVPFTTIVNNTDILRFFSYPSDNPAIETFINPSIAVKNTGMFVNSDEVIQSLDVEAGAELTIRSNRSLTVSSVIENSGIVNIENNGSLVQTGNEANSVIKTGVYNVEREHTAVNTARYSYWSSPVVGETFRDAFPNSNSSDWYTLNPTVAGGWQSFGGTDVMESGFGYTSTLDSTGPIVTQVTETIIFSGAEIGNRVVQYSAPTPFSSGDYALIGNPYPSAINADSVILNNPASTGTLYFFDDQDPNPNQKGTGDYATYTTSGVVASTYGFVPTINIPTAQGFVVEANTPNPTFTFNNNMRISAGSFTGDNDNFNKKASKERFWVNLLNDSTQNQILFSFEDGATKNADWAKDGKIYRANRFSSFYSKIGEQDYVIQALPRFQNTQPQRIALGVDAWTIGDYTVTIDHFDNWPSQQDIYLLDAQSGQLVDLRNGDYTFTVHTAGVISNRFFLMVYPAASTGLGTEENEVAHLGWYQNGSRLEVFAPEDTEISQIKLIALNGATVKETTQSLSMNVSDLSKGVYLLRAQTNSGAQMQEKVFIR